MHLDWKNGISLRERIVEASLYNAMDQRGGKTYLFVQPQPNMLDFGNVYQSKNSENHAEGRLPQFETKSLNLNVWMNKSPCTKCAKYLMSKYRNVAHNKKPTLHVAYFFAYTDKQYDRDNALECLAKMYREGFKIKPWNWEKFETFLKLNDFYDEELKQFIDKVRKTDLVECGQKRLQNVLKQAKELNASKTKLWCNNY